MFTKFQKEPLQKRKRFHRKTQLQKWLTYENKRHKTESIKRSKNRIKKRIEEEIKEMGK